MDLLIENKLRNFIRNAFGVVKKPFDIKGFSKGLMELSPLIISIENVYGNHTNDYSIAVMTPNRIGGYSGSRVIIHFDHDGTIAHISSHTESPNINVKKIVKFFEEWMFKSINTENSDKAEIIFKTFINWFNSKKEKSIKENESNESSGNLDVKSFSEGIIKFSKFIKDIRLIEPKESEQVHYLVEMIDGGDLVVLFVGDALYNSTPFATGSQQAREMVKFLSKYATRQINSEKAISLRPLFVMFKNLIDSKNNKRIDENVVLKKYDSNMLSDFYNSLKSIYNDVVSIAEKRSPNSFLQTASSVYTMAMADGGAIAVFFKSDGGYNGILTGERTELVKKAENILLPYDKYILINRAVEDRNVETVFKSFMNSVNNKKQINEENSANAKVKFNVKNFASNIMKLKNKIKSIEKYIPAKELNAKYQNGYIIWIDSNAGIIIYFDKDGRLISDKGFDYPNYNKDLQAEMFKFYNEWSFITKRYENTSESEKAEIVFKTFANYINSRNNKKISESTDKENTLTIKDFKKSLESIEPYISSIKKLSDDKVIVEYIITTKEGGQINITFFSNSNIGYLMDTDRRGPLNPKSEQEIFRVLRPYWYDIKSPQYIVKYAKQVFDTFANMINFKKQK